MQNRLGNDETTQQKRYDVLTALTSDTGRAVQLAQQWVRSAPGEGWAWLMLAEAQTVASDPAAALDALERAQPICQDHPMFYRAVFLAALAARAFTAAHGALSLARTQSLPQLILQDMEESIRPFCLQPETGGFVEAENPEPRWRQLFPPGLWRPAASPIRLVWDEVGSRIWILDDAAVSVADGYLRGQGYGYWSAHPGFARLDQFVRTVSGQIIREQRLAPWMLQSFTVARLQAALHLYGYFPWFAGANSMVIHVGSGLFRIDMALDPTSLDASVAFGIASDEQTIHTVARWLDPALANWVTLAGPDSRVARVLPWLLPQEIRMGEDDDGHDAN